MPYIGELAALTAAFMWGGTAIFFDKASRRIGPLNTNLIRILLGALMLMITLYCTRGYFYPLTATHDQVLWLGSSGIIGLAIGDGALFVCLVILGPRLATLLLSLAPPITTVVAWIFLHETLGLQALSGILLTIAGIYWVVNERTDETVHGSKTLGILMGIIAAIGQGVGIIFAKQAFQTDIDALSATILRMVPAAVSLWLFALLTGKIGALARSLRDRRALTATFGGSVFGPYLGVWLSIVAVKYTKAGIAATLLATVPILIIPMTMIIYKSRPSPRSLIGTAIAILGVALIFTR